MPKDASKYRYFHVGILWDSETLADIEQDLIDSHMEEQPAKLVALRLAEYYRLARRGFIIPGITAKMKAVAPEAAQRSNGHRPASGRAEQENDQNEEQQEANAEGGDNVDGAADYWEVM